MVESENKMMVRFAVQLQNGKDKEYAVSNLLLRQAIGAHHEFDISLSGTELDTSISKELQTQLGKPIQIRLFKDKLGIEVLSFRGVITGIKLSHDSEDYKTMTLTGSSPTIRMDDGKNSRCFKNTTYTKLIRTIIEPYVSLDKKIGTDSDKEPQLPIFTQYKESNFNVLLRICELSGNWVYYDGTKLIISARPAGNQKEIHIGHTGGHYRIGANLVPVNLEYRTYEYIQAEVFKVNTGAETKSENSLVKIVANASGELFTSRPIAPSVEYHPTNSDFENYGKTMQSTYISGSVRISGNSSDPTLTLGDTIRLIESEDGREVLVGKFIVIEVQHQADHSGYYQNQFEAIPADVQTPPMNTQIIYPKGEDQTAKVIENDDPEKLGRVKVQFFWQDDREESNWIRVLSPMGGKDHGLYYIPEIGDQALVGFEFENPSRPYVKGVFYNNKQKADTLFNRVDSKVAKIIKNESMSRVKGWITEKGNYLLFNDGARDVTVISTRDGLSQIILSVDADGSMQIHAGGEINIEAKNIEIKAEERLSLSSKNIEIKADQKLEQSGTSEVVVKGGIIRLN